MKKALLSLFALLILTVFTACGSSEGTTAPDNNSDAETQTEDTNKETKSETTEGGTLTIAWLPNESGADIKAARDAIGKEIEEATGMKVEHQTTTDYIIAIEAIANGNADLAFLGAQGYVEAHTKNSNVLPLVVTSGASGTIDDAVYYSWLAVKNGNEDEYKNGDEFSIDNIAGKRFSFVSNSSTSGFKVPANGIVSHFTQMDEHKDLTDEDLLEGGDFFSEVLYGGSHQGSAVNLITDKADVAAFCDACVQNYIELASGEENRAGSVYKVKEGADEPFNTFPGEEFVLISVTPVLNAPFVMNTDNIGEDLQKKLLELFTSDAMANNEEVFVPKDSGENGLFYKTEAERFLEVEDAWFNPIRELSK
ncbi:MULTISPECIES: phosphate/phosphite/phosphonate ABC transporter substrate-binding protein [Bacillaceae]|uniref:phosphate/phosphite/phosphonate ABC transporter substrate-binding protein n=1 Tax=Bacillaceae TaxID=186817 RepID=UPI0004796A00|nr:MULTISPECIES: phosphate/phosphite/phosphonate ABC transporter substrate-binding protein [Bacillaceae]UOE94892.1 phosphate/phosphite/phosphonate ABC transporter substrate-binding protein [Alkalihalobacillus sp. LMS39]